MASDCVGGICENQGKNDVADAAGQPDGEEKESKAACELRQGDISSKGHYHVEGGGPCAEEYVSCMGELCPGLEIGDECSDYCGGQDDIPGLNEANMGIFDALRHETPSADRLRQARAEAGIQIEKLRAQVSRAR